MSVNRIQIQQVLLGLIRNSLDAMQNADRQGLTVTTMTGNPGMVRVVVADTGCGVASDSPENFFEPRTTAATGHLSLGICRSIVEGHGGKIWSARNATAGMTVTFELPSAG